MSAALTDLERQLQDQLGRFFVPGLYVVSNRERCQVELATPDLAAARAARKACRGFLWSYDERLGWRTDGDLDTLQPWDDLDTHGRQTV